MGPLGVEDTGIALDNKLADFGALNCRWVNGQTRNPKVKKEKLRRPGRKSTNLSISLDKDHVQWLKMQAFNESIKRKCHVSANRMLRELIEKHMPHPKTMDMLGDRK